MGKALEFRTCECFHKRYQSVDLRVSEIERADTSAQEIIDGIALVGYTAIVVMDDDFAKGFDASVVHVRSRDGNVAQGWCFERAEIVKAACYRETADLGCFGIGEHLEVNLFERVCRFEKRTGEFGDFFLDVVDPNTNVVKPVVGKKSLRLFNPVAGYAPPCIDEQVESLLLERSQRVFISAVEKPVECRVAAYLSAFERGDGLGYFVHRYRVTRFPEHRLECSHIIGIRSNHLENRLMVLEAHFNWIQKRVQGLIFETGGPPIPKLGPEIQSVDHGRGVSSAGELVDPFGYFQRTVREGFFSVVTRGATHFAVGTESLIVKELVTERNFFRSLGIVRRVRRRGSPNGGLSRPPK